MMDKKNEFIKYANSFQTVAKLKLENITELMNLLGNPQDCLKFIHVAGTNGKGSFCAFMQNILTSAGFRCGKYTSPNMIRVNERISIDNVDISDDDLYRLILAVEEKIDKVKEKTGSFPTQFEIWTAVAFCYFKEKNCDYVVLETGLGGAQDATNVIKNPIVSVITKIDIDHTQYLGNTLSSIAKEKSGIIKECNFNGCTISAIQYPEVSKVLKEIAKKRNNRLVCVDKPNTKSFNDFCECFCYKNFENLKIKLLGEHQIQNACLAIECAMYLGIEEEYIKKGLLNAKNPGRLELLEKKPYVLFDGAHNKNGMNALKNALTRYFPTQKKSFIMGFMGDKDILGALEELNDSCHLQDANVFLISVKNNPRTASTKQLSEIFAKLDITTTQCSSILDAYKKAKALGDMIVICGSLYLYKDFYDDCFNNIK